MRLILKYTWEYIKRNKALSYATVIVITITFILINLFVSAQILIDKLANYLNSQQKISIIYNPDASEKEIMAFKNELSKFPAVKKIVYEDSKTLQRENLKALGFNEEEIKTFLEDQEEYIKILQIQLEPNKDIQNLVNYIKQAKDKGAPIMSVLYFEELLSKIRTISRGLKVTGLIVTSLLLFISLQLIYFTISFSVYKQRREIKTMYLVGAPKNKIILPFALQGAIYGAVSALLSVLLGWGTLIIIKKTLRNNLFLQILKGLLVATGLRSLISSQLFLGLLIIELLSGFLLGFIFARLATNNTIKKLNYD